MGIDTPMLACEGISTLETNTGLNCPFSSSFEQLMRRKMIRTKFRYFIKEIF